MAEWKMAVLFEKWRQEDLEAAKAQLEIDIWQAFMPQTPEQAQEQAQRKLRLAEIKVTIAQRKETAEAKNDLAKAERERELAEAKKNLALATLMKSPGSEALQKEHDAAVKAFNRADENFQFAFRGGAELKEEQRRQEQSGALGQHPFYFEFLDALFRKRPVVSVHSGVRKTGWTKIE
mmetsp:Transcript_692/g.1559  ORF Transcript_692/g.1559 Transcript_692/m.1559 type:complete len:178 (-) Transcript_692:611-1144(-)